MWPTEDELESIDSIIDRMNPIVGFPYPMKTARNDDFASNVGNPWIGAYTKNGYWYKMSYGGNEEWEEIVEEMQYRNNFMLDSETYSLYLKLFGDSQDGKNEENSSSTGAVKLLIVKNISGEVLASAIVVEHYGYTSLGAIFVSEDYRHVGIGETIMNEICKSKKNCNLVFNCISYLLPSIVRYANFEPRVCRKINKITIENPYGFTELLELPKNYICKKSDELSDEDFITMNNFCESTIGEKKNWKDLSKQKTMEVFAIFESDLCLGICVRRDIQNQENNGKGIPDLLISPLYAENPQISEMLLKKAVAKYHNPEDDYDFDVDVFAIYRRNISFFVYAENGELVMPVLTKFAGNESKIQTDRVYFQTCSNFVLPAIVHVNIFAADDLHVFIV